MLALLVGCEAEGETGAVSSCEPLAASTATVSLASVVAAGQGADGTVYVIDRDHGELRAFVSQADELYRQRVSGSGEGNADGSFVTVSLNELDPPLVIQVTTDRNGVTQMGVAMGPLDSKTFVIGEEGEELTLMATSDAEGLPIHDYPAEILVEYAAVLEDGRQLVVLRPRDFSDYSEFRVFFGPLEHLDERRVSNVTRARDGGSTNIDFEIDGEPAHAAFPVELVDDTFTPGTPSLAIGERDVTLSLSTPPAGAEYYCAD
jgi:hypothetical protein